MKSIKEALPQAVNIMKEMGVTQFLSFGQMMIVITTLFPQFIRNYYEMKEVMSKEEIQEELDRLYIKGKELIQLEKQETVTEEEVNAEIEKLMAQSPFFKNINKSTIMAIVEKF